MIVYHSIVLDDVREDDVRWANEGYSIFCVGSRNLVLIGCKFKNVGNS